MLTALAAMLTLVLSVVCGITLAFHARPTIRYGAALTLLFIPFAMGESVWAYSMARLASSWGVQSELVSSGTFNRAAVLFLLCLAKTVPLGTFFCATTLQRYTSETRAYFQIHQLRLPFFFLSALDLIPKSILVLVGLFGGALMASEAPLATFLYRANPGTAPETANIMLARVFREIYASSGPQSLPRVAILGVIVSVLLLGSAVAGTFVGTGALWLFKSALKRSDLLTKTSTTVFSVLPRLLALSVLMPGILGLAGVLIPTRFATTAYADAVEQTLEYRSIGILGVFVGGTLTVIGIAIAVRCRYSQRDLLAALEKSWIAACLLLVPAFIPVLSVVAILGKISNGQIAGVSGYISLVVSHIGLHYSVFQFICMTLIAAIPERHVSWQRTMKMSYLFSLFTDGFKRHAAVIVCLLGLGTVQVITDGSVSRWFSHLVKAPEEALYAAVFGRLSSAVDAAIISWSVTLVATLVCVALATAYVRELRIGSRYA